MRRSSNCASELARSSSSSRSCVLRSRASFRLTSSLRSSKRSCKRRFSLSNARTSSSVATIRREGLSGTALGHVATVFEVITALSHQGGERVLVLREHSRPNALYRFAKGFQRLRAIVVETLDFEIQFGTLLRDA